MAETHVVSGMTPLAKLAIIPFEQLHGIGAVGEMTGGALTLLEGLMGMLIILGLFLVAGETDG